MVGNPGLDKQDQGKGEQQSLQNASFQEEDLSFDKEGLPDGEELLHETHHDQPNIVLANVSNDSTSEENEEETVEEQSKNEEKGESPPPPCPEEVTLTREEKNDLVEGKYYVVSEEPLLEFDNEFLRAFAVVDKRKRACADLVAFVYHKSASIRHHVISKLKMLTLPQLITPIAAEITYVSSLKEFAYAVIIKRPKGHPLSHIIESSGPLPLSFIKEKIVDPIGKILSVFETIGLCHGRINLQNIYMNDEGVITLGECISDPAGFSQPSCYETLERAGCIPIGKGEDTVSIDYFALGVSCFLLLKGQAGFDHEDQSELLDKRLIEGTFNAYAMYSEFSPTSMDLCKGLLADKVTGRWRGQQLREWQKGKPFNLVRVPRLIEASRSIMFGEHQYFNRTSLAQALFTNWLAGLAFISDDRLSKWVEGSVGIKELGEDLRLVQSNFRGRSRLKTFITPDDIMLSKIILLLDQLGPIRLKTLAIHPQSLGTALAYAMGKEQQDMISLLKSVFGNSILESYRVDDQTFQGKTISMLKNMGKLLDKPWPGFGLERCLYALQPILPCQSPLVSSYYASNINDLLKTLEEVCANKKKLSLDRHIAAYIAEKINLHNDLLIQNLASIPHVQRHPAVYDLAILYAAQKHSKYKKLKHLPRAIAESLVELQGFIHSQTLRDSYLEDLQKAARTGKFSYIYKLIAEGAYFIQDYFGFEKAKRDYHALETQVEKLENKGTIKGVGYQYGLQIGVILSYCITCLILIILLIKG